MLENQLATGKDIITQLEQANDHVEPGRTDMICLQINALKKLCSEARQAWASSVFLDYKADALQRYFTFHLRELTSLSVQSASLVETPLHNCNCKPAKSPRGIVQDLLNNLTDYLFEYFWIYNHLHINVPVSYFSHILRGLTAEINAVKISLNSVDVPVPLKNGLIKYISHLSIDSTSRKFTYYELFYFQRLIISLDQFFKNNAAQFSASTFAELLVEFDFNHLEVFTWLQEDIILHIKGKRDRDKVKYMEQKLLSLPKTDSTQTSRFNHKWAPVVSMLSLWLETELSELKPQVVDKITLQENKLKFKLEIPESHLACLIRMLKLEKRLGNIPLTEIFQFISNNFSTARAVKLSPGGISKEYYSVNQITAAEVKDLLQKMISRINRDFFPVVVAASILIRVCLNR